MQFIPVTATQSNSQGHVVQNPGGGSTSSFKINIDLVSAINGQEVFLKTGTILQLGANYFVNFRLSGNVKIE